MNDYWTEHVKGGAGCGGGTDLFEDRAPAYNLTGNNGCIPGTQYCYEEALFRRTTQRIIAEHESNGPPLFLYYAPHLVHEPLEVPDWWMQQFSFMSDDTPTHSRQTYSAMVAYLDSELGNMTSQLMSKGMWEQTLFILQSDNVNPTTCVSCGSYLVFFLKASMLVPHRGGRSTVDRVLPTGEDNGRTQLTKRLAHMTNNHTSRDRDFAQAAPRRQTACVGGGGQSDGVRVWRPPACGGAGDQAERRAQLPAPL
jgi:hypothetical protein